MNRDAEYFRNLGWEQLRGRWEDPVIFTLVFKEKAKLTIIVCVTIRYSKRFPKKTFTAWISKTYNKRIIVKSKIIIWIKIIICISKYTATITIKN